MKALIGKWGQSAGLRIPKDILDRTRLAVGDAVELSVQDGKVILTPARPPLDREAIFAAMADKEPPELMEWGPLAGREIW
ncbi:AbrB/MazE/SpoVT family DNA-binding domain-containing protein [Hyphomonadaceae bacterium ML37]|nr:AbrB/MazE/SpoVT family DNA-binding domain-containing protein [Hyphomonadaceae bacterium ML37]